MTRSSSFDRHGRTVEVGMMVRVLGLHPAAQDGLSEEEWARLNTIIGDVLTVNEIDEYGSVWVEKWWNEGPGYHVSHSIALGPSEIELA